MAELRSAVARLWWWLRQVSGDAAYERYLETAARRGARGRVVSREEFYVEMLRRKYTGVSRCC